MVNGIDRGGLNYPIRVEDQFTVATTRFRAEIGASTRAFREFRNALSQGTTGSSRLRGAADAASAQVRGFREGAAAAGRQRSEVDNLTAAEQRLTARLRNQRIAELELQVVRSRGIEIENEATRAIERRFRAEERSLRAIDARDRAQRRLLQSTRREALQARGETGVSRLSTPGVAELAARAEERRRNTRLRERDEIKARAEEARRPLPALPGKVDPTPAKIARSRAPFNDPAFAENIARELDQEFNDRSQRVIKRLAQIARIKDLRARGEIGVNRASSPAAAEFAARAEEARRERARPLPALPGKTQTQVNAEAKEAKRAQDALNAATEERRKILKRTSDELARLFGRENRQDAAAKRAANAKLPVLGATDKLPILPATKEPRQLDIAALRRQAEALDFKLARQQGDPEKLRERASVLDSRLRGEPAGRARFANVDAARGAATAEDALRSARARVTDTTKAAAKLELQRARAELLRRGEPLSRLRFQDIGSAQSAARSENIGRTAEQKRKAADEAKRLAKGLKDSNTNAQTLLGTIGRIAQAFVIVRGIQAIATGFRESIAAAINFNRVLEQSQVGISALFVAVGKVQNAQGETVTGAKAFALAQGEAKRQAALLRQESLRTAATFEELVQTFQVAVGPGLSAGFDVNQIRKFTVQVSQAAAAVGLSQQELSEEIRSLLTGSITPRSTRIATALGITNKDIKQAKDAGNLADFLTRKFSAFGIAANESLNSFDTLFKNVRDSLEQLIGTGSIGFFEELKGLFRDIFALTTRPAEGGILQPNPELLKVVDGFVSGLKNATAEARRLVTTLNVGDLQAIATALGGAITAAAQILGPLIQGFVAGFADVSKVVNSIVKRFQKLTGVMLFNNPSIREALILVGEILVVFKGIQVALQVFAGLPAILTLAIGPARALSSIITGAIVPAVGTLLSTVSSIALALGPLGLGVIALAVGLGIAVFAAVRLANALAGTELKLGSVIRLVGQLLAGTVDSAFDTVSTRFDQLVGLAKIAGLKLAKALQQGFASVTDNSLTRAINQGLDALGLLSDASKLAADQARQNDAKALAATDLLIVAEKVKLGVLERQLQARKDARVQNAFDNAAANNQSSIAFSDILEGGAKLAKEKIQAILNDLDLKLGGGVDKEIEKVKELKQELATVKILPVRGGLFDDFVTQLETALQEMADGIKGTVNLIQGAIQQVASTVSGLIVDAFDPTAEVDVKARFGQLLKALSQMILQFIIQLLIAKAILAAIGGIGGAVAGSAGSDVTAAAAGLNAGAGFAEGGKAPRRARASLAHFMARGFDEGGTVAAALRPAGLDARDTVPIWVRPGEFMFPPETVSEYGGGVMEAIRRRLVDPTALRALAGGRKLSPARPRGGFATGGQVGGGSAAPSAPSSASGVAQAVVVANEQSMDRLLAGGASAMRRWLSSNGYQPRGRA